MEKMEAAVGSSVWGLGLRVLKGVSGAMDP